MLAFAFKQWNESKLFDEELITWILPPKSSSNVRDLAITLGLYAPVLNVIN